MVRLDGAVGLDVVPEPRDLVNIFTSVLPIDQLVHKHLVKIKHLK